MHSRPPAPWDRSGFPCRVASAQPRAHLSLPCSGATHFQAVCFLGGLPGPAQAPVGRDTGPYSAGQGLGSERSPFFAWEEAEERPELGQLYSTGCELVGALWPPCWASALCGLQAPSPVHPSISVGVRPSLPSPPQPHWQSRFEPTVPEHVRTADTGPDMFWLPWPAHGPLLTLHSLLAHSANIPWDLSSRPGLCWAGIRA